MQYTELSNVIDIFENNKAFIVQEWLALEVVSEVLKKYDIEADFFKDEYAYNIFQYYVNVVHGEQEIGNCPTMNKFLALLANKNIAPHDVYMICLHFRRVLVDFSFDNFTVSKTLINELTYIADMNLNGVLAEYETILSQKNKKIHEQSVLFEQYKEVVDKTAIVSKTDLKVA